MKLNVIMDVASILNVAPNSLNDESKLGSIAQWDSMTHIDIMLYLEKNFDIQINEKSIEFYSEFKNLRALNNS